MIKCRLCEQTDPDNLKEFQRFNKHLLSAHPGISLYKYKKEFGIDVEPEDILMDKLQCTSYLQLAGLLGASRGGVLNSLKTKIGRKSLQRSYKIIAILLKRMPEPELKKSLREIRFLRDFDLI